MSAYGPLVVSAASLVMWPAAAARNTTPRSASAPPIAMESAVGRASHKYTAANANPSGTRTRLAMPDQLRTRASVSGEQLLGGRNDVGGSDREQAGVAAVTVRVGSHALAAAQNNAARSVRAVARGIGGTKNRHHGNTQRCRQVHRAGVAAEEQAGAAGKGDQVGQRGHAICWVRQSLAFQVGGGQRLRSAATLCSDRGRQCLLAGSKIDQRPQAKFAQRACDLRIALGRPLLCSPSRTGAQDGELAQMAARQLRFASALGAAIQRQFGDCLGRGSAGYRRREREVLLDNVGSACLHTSAVQDACRLLSRVRKANPLPCARHYGQSRGLDGSLEIH